MSSLVGAKSYHLQVDIDNGVPLEHLITCAQDVLIHWNKDKSYKYLQWEREKINRAELNSKQTTQEQMHHQQRGISFDDPIDSDMEDMFEMGAVGGGSWIEDRQRKLNHFAHLVIKLLKGVSKCIIPISKFNCEFYRKYGLQCRVADYGHTRLIDLLEAIPHVVQIIDGEFEKKITLTHRVQVTKTAS